MTREKYIILGQIKDKFEKSMHHFNIRDDQTAISYMKLGIKDFNELMSQIEKPTKVRKPKKQLQYGGFK